MGNSNRITEIVEEYKTVIETQMHFNDMLMKMRTTIFSVIIAIFGGAAAILGQYPLQFINICNFKFHISATVIFFGIILLIAIFIMDYFYYYKMLLGAVKRGYEFDDYFKNINPNDDFKLFGMSSRIRDSIGRPGLSKCILFSFYGIILAGGIAYLLIIIFSIRPI